MPYYILITYKQVESTLDEQNVATTKKGEGESFIDTLKDTRERKLVSRIV